ncbi:MAG: hypothetical protein QNK37_03320 [Acidobacteriota bacterium]|nr:hypothetical protein [Acidobacteriota bacterium]
MQPPKYIQVVRLLAPGKMISFREAANLGSRHFSWYKDYENPVKEMEKMLRSSLKRYPELITVIEEKQFIDTSLALNFAHSKYPTSYYEETIESCDYERPRSLKLTFVAVMSFLLMGFFLMIDSNNLTNGLYHAKNVEGLLILNRMTKKEVPVDPAISDEIHQIEEDFDLNLKYSSEKYAYPLREEVAHRISNLYNGHVFMHNDNLVGIFPHLNEPTWLVENDGVLHPIHIGTPIKTYEAAGTVVDVNLYRLTFMNDSGFLNQFERPLLKHLGIFPEIAGPKSLIFPMKDRGNWEFLSSFLGMEINPGIGNVFGAFPPWKDYDSLKKILENDIRFFPGFYEQKIDFRGSASDFLSVVLKEWPGEFELGVYNDIIWYRGEPFSDCLQSLNMMVVSKGDQIEIWELER